LFEEHQAPHQQLLAAFFSPVNARCLPKLPPLTPDGKKDSALLRVLSKWGNEADKVKGIARHNCRFVNKILSHIIILRFE
jgi:hypothetical protein